MSAFSLPVLHAAAKPEIWWVQVWPVRAAWQRAAPLESEGSLVWSRHTPGEAGYGRCAAPAAPSACERAGPGRGDRWQVVPQRAAFRAGDPQRDEIANRRYAAGCGQGRVAQGAGGR